jgi:hypothetical protein
MTRESESASNLTARIAREFGQPLLPVPRGTVVSGQLVRLEDSHSGRSAHLAVVIGETAVHVIGVGEDARRLVGKRVEVVHHGGIVRMQLREREAVLTREGIAARAEHATGKRLVGNFHGAQGRLTDVASDGAGRSWAVVESHRALHVLRTTAAERSNVGKRVKLEFSDGRFGLRVQGQEIER